jgi:hypothetical protein
MSDISTEGSVAKPYRENPPTRFVEVHWRDAGLIIVDSGPVPPYTREPFMAYSADGHAVAAGTAESVDSWITHQAVPASFYQLTWEGGIEPVHHNGYPLAGSAYGSNPNNAAGGRSYATQVFFYVSA